ncbi:MAG: DNA lyase [Euryarchaeota archaeon]|nr:DNA lyase [Euryarchaeota archaeon]
MKKEFKIRANEFKGPINLSLTINSGQTSQPSWIKKDGYFRELISVDGKPCLIKITQKGDNPENPLEVMAQSINDLKVDAIKGQIMEIFGLNHDLDKLYDFLRNDPKLEPTINFCKGLRLFKAHDIFECLISSISSANCSILRWNRSIRDIKRKWGDEYKFSREPFYTFPSPQILATLPEHDLEEMQRCEDDLPENFVFDNNLQACGVGYRAKYIINASRMVQDEINLEKLGKMKYDKAFNTILQIPGVGPKVADCILLYGYGFGEAFPVDLWIKRIICKLYFDGEDIPVPKIRSFGIERFGEYAGYVQLYLFHYARKSGLLERLKP